MTTSTAPASIALDAATFTAAVSAAGASGEGLLPAVPPVSDPGAVLAAGWQLPDGELDPGLAAALDRLRAPRAVVRVVTLDPNAGRTSCYDLVAAPDGYVAANLGDGGLRAVVLQTDVEAATFLADSAAVFGPAGPPSEESLALPYPALTVLAVVADLRREERLRTELARDQAREIAFDAASLRAAAERLTTVDLRWSVPVLGAVAPTQLFVEDWAEAGLDALVAAGLVEIDGSGATVSAPGAALTDSLARLVKVTTLSRLLLLGGSLTLAGAVSVWRALDRVLVVVWADPEPGTVTLYDAGVEGAVAVLRAFLAVPHHAEVAPDPDPVPVASEETEVVAAARAEAPVGARATVDAPLDVWDLAGADAVVGQLVVGTEYLAFEERDGWQRVLSPDGTLHGWVDAAGLRFP